jgi:YesN/AraC family two-component response regulator
MIVTDIRMPIVSGFDIIRAVKTHKKLKNSGSCVFNFPTMKMFLAKNLGASEYFVKPIMCPSIAQLPAKF